MTAAAPPCPPAWLEGLNALAEQAIGLSEPNPRVACRIITPDGRCFEGHTQAAGGPHAEVMALRAAQAAGASLVGASAAVTLEPCSHHGRTPPCCDALIDAGLAHVVVALGDPNPLVAGRGIARLRAAGVQVTVLDATHPLALATRELNIGFLSRMERGRPWVRLKIAASLDGSTALPNGASQWITGEAARIDGHAWRRRASAILSGIGTVRADDPRLDVRWLPTPRQPQRVVVDSQLAIAPQARVLHPPGQAWVVTAAAPATNVAARQALHALGVTVIDCPAAAASANQPAQVDLPALLRELGRREVNELHVEAGQGLNGALLRCGLVDELLIYLAPKLLGPGARLAQIGPFDQIAQGLALTFTDITPIGADVRLRARLHPA